jgi:hypothetical protein
VIHDEIVAEVQRRAKARGVLSHYCGRSTHCRGDRGLPDLLLAGPYESAWIEVKSPGDELAPGQTTWKHMLRAAGQRHYVIGPAELDDGRVDEILAIVSGRP